MSYDYVRGSDYSDFLVSLDTVWTWRIDDTAGISTKPAKPEYVLKLKPGCHYLLNRCVVGIIGIVKEGFRSAWYAVYSTLPRSDTAVELT